MAGTAQRLRGLAAAAAEARRTLENRVSDVAGEWSDSVRREFEADHLATIRTDARHLHAELDDLARLADAAIRQLGSER